VTEGARLIIADPVATFRGVTEEDPWTLVIQYDY
jgi:hypothetical protein